MEPRTRTYFIADSHLGQKVGDPADREQRLVSLLRDIRSDAGAHSLYLLGDIWDFWYEYRDVIPREGIRVVSELIQLMDSGVQVHFIPGNHDIWCYSFFESIGMRRLDQPAFVRIGDRDFCLGHGDALGGAHWSYRLMLKVFHCRFLQRLFSALHPWLAFRFGLRWSADKRRARSPYHFRGESEPLYKFALATDASRHVDFFVFGHFHDQVDLTLPSGARFCILKDWISCPGRPCAVFDSATSSFSLNC